MVFCPRGKKDDQNLELAMVFCPRGKKTRFTPYNQGVKLLIIQGVSIFLLNCHSRFLPYGFYGTFRSAVFPIHFPCSFAYRWCDGAPGHFPRPPTPIPPHIHRHTQHLYTHGHPSRRDSNPCWPRGGGRKSVDSSFHHPTVSPW
jgi:hypothetical protein